jgi:DNA-binding transcriptional ArsR family regulator
MIRVHLTDADLRRTTIAVAPVMLELGSSVIRGRNPHLARPWDSNGAVGGLDRPAPPLLELILDNGFIPDFLHPLSATDFAAGLNAVLDAPTNQLRRDIAALHREARATRWTRDLAAGDVPARRRLGTVLSGYYDTTFGRLWETAQRVTSADLGMRARLLAERGVDHLLATLHPDIEWKPPTLTLCCRFADVRTLDLRPGGRGLVLYPSLFAPVPTCLDLPDGRVGLVYCARRQPHRITVDERLTALLGSTRAAVLTTLAIPATTTQLARRVGISLASASQHTTVLRAAGLISTSRVGSAVLHSQTPLGARLADAAA